MPTAGRSEAAERDLRDIAYHVAFRDRRPLTADRIIDELIAQAEKIAELSATTMLAASHPAIDARVSRQEINRETVCACLRAAQAAVQALMAEFESGRFDSYDMFLLGDEFEPVLRNLCLAWYLRYLSAAEISSLDPTSLQELGSWLPSWQWNYRVIPLGQEEQE